QFGHQPIQVVPDADKRHYVADINPSTRKDRDVLIVSFERAQEYAVRHTAQPVDDFAQAQTVQLAGRDVNLKLAARNGPHDILTFDPIADSAATIADDGPASSISSPACNRASGLISMSSPPCRMRSTTVR